MNIPDRILRRLNIPPRITQPIVVVPDREMRERERVSLNMLPNMTDWAVESGLSERMKKLNEPVCIHRKSWEYAICVEGLHRLGAVRPNAKALAVAAGRERPIFYFANCIDQMVATDLYDGSFVYEATPTMLTNPLACAPFPYREDHLSVKQMRADKLGFPDGTFDFAFCLSSIEHFGSRSVQRQAFDEMARVLKPAGFLCITTELILTNHRHDEYFRWDEINAIFLSHPRMTLVGGKPDLSIARSLVEYPVNLLDSTRIHASPHIVLCNGRMLWTSLSMFFQKSLS